MSNVVPIRKAPELGDGKQPPHDPAAEAACLTTAMLQPAEAAAILAVAGPEDFFWAAHRAIAEAIAHLVAAGEACDMTSVGIRLHETGKSAILGGVAFLSEMANQVPAITNPRKYAERVRDLARVRKLADAARLVLAEAYEPIDDIGAWLGRSDAAIGEVTRAAGRVRAVSAMTAVKESIRRLGEPIDDRITTGIRDLDSLTTGFEPDSTYVIAGRPGMGKTALGLQTAVAAAKSGARVLFVSLEMNRTQLMDRMLSAETGIPLQAFRKRDIAPGQWSKLSYASAQIGGLPLVIADAPGQTLLDIRATTRSERAGIVFVDHIGLMKPIGGSQASKRSREQEVAEFSRGLKAISKELRIPVVMLCQVNRDVAKGARRPQLSDLRESGAIEQDADNVWFIHRPGYYDPKASDEVKRQAELIVAKQRQGPQDIVALTWLAEYTRFYATEMERDS